MNIALQSMQTILHRRILTRFGSSSYFTGLLLDLLAMTFRWLGDCFFGFCLFLRETSPRIAVRRRHAVNVLPAH